MRLFINLLLLLVIAATSCKKDTAGEPLVNTISGDYKGLLLSVTYQTYTGITTIDTLQTDLTVQCTYNNIDSLYLHSSEAIFNNKVLAESVIADTGNAHYGDDKSFFKEPSPADTRFFYLGYNQTAVDSIFINSYLPPSGSWNTQLYYYGRKM
ncbi:MAG: hypothetical protein K1X61_04295 [Chitinophagales bacterium]|nr:hypothetical protein [Chitinophagales bacterium]